VQRSVKTTKYRTHFRRFRTVCQPISCDALFAPVRALSKPRNFAVAVLCSRGWPTLATWRTSRRCGRYWPKPASLPELRLDGATWRACAAAWGFFVPAPFLRELYAGEKHSRRATLAGGPFSRLGRRRAHVGVLRPGQPVWGDLPGTTRRGAPVRQRAAFRSRIGFLQLGDARLFAFLAAIWPRAGGVKESPNGQPRGMRRAVKGSPEHDGSKARRQTPHVPVAD
jgi:hypothetical protein